MTDIGFQGKLAVAGMVIPAVVWIQYTNACPSRKRACFPCRRNVSAMPIIRLCLPMLKFSVVIMRNAPMHIPEWCPLAALSYVRWRLSTRIGKLEATELELNDSFTYRILSAGSGHVSIMTKELDPT